MSVSTVALNQAFTAYCAKCKQKEVTLRWNKWPNNCSNETRSSRPRENVIGCTDVSQEAHKETSRKTCIKLPVCSIGAHETARESTSSSSGIWNLSSPSSPRSITPVAVHVNPHLRNRKTNDNSQKVRCWIRALRELYLSRDRYFTNPRLRTYQKSVARRLMSPWPRAAQSSFTSASLITGTTHTTSVVERKLSHRARTLDKCVLKISRPSSRPSFPVSEISEILRNWETSNAVNQWLFFQLHLSIESFG